MDKEIVTDYGNLYQAYRQAKSGKKFNSSTARFSNVALDGINILKEQLEKEYLKWCLECIREMLKTLGLELNGKTQIIPFRKGMRYLGFHHYMTADGKYIRKLTGENKRKNKKKFRKLVKDVKAGKLTEEKFYEKYNSWKNHALHGNCIKFVHSMDLYIEKLMKEVME